MAQLKSGSTVGGDNVLLDVEDSVGASNIADNAVTLAKMASGTDGELITYDASGAPATVGVGTSGQVLTSNGAGSAPTMQDAGGGFDSGVKMVFAQAAAPTGWTQDTSSNDAALRVVSGSGGGTGGSAGFSAPSHSLSGGSTTLSTAQMPSHDHTAIYTTRSGYQGAAYLIPYQQWFYHNNTFSKSGNIGVSGGNSSHNHSLSGSITAPKYKDVIVATKD
jgi:hypothetical protein